MTTLWIQNFELGPLERILTPQNNKYKMDTKRDSSSEDENTSWNFTPYTDRALNDWWRRRASATGQGRGQMPGGMARESDSSEGSATPSGPPVGIDGMIGSPHLQAPWLARLVEDLLTPSKTPVLECRDGVVNLATHRLDDDAEMHEFMIDLLYQSLFYKQHKRMEQSSREQAWKAFLKNYSKSPEHWHEKLEPIRSDFEARNPVGAKIRAHRLCMQAGIACAVRRQYNCPMCLPGAPKFENVVMNYCWKPKVLSASLCESINKVEEQCAVSESPPTVPPHIREEYDRVVAESSQLQFRLQSAKHKLSNLCKEVADFAVKSGSLTHP
jgi:hypothetical protein